MPRSPENIFLALLHYLDGQGLSVSLRVLLLPLLLIVLAIGGSAWLVHQQLEEVSELQIRAIGNTLADQIAGMASVPMHDNDLISLQATLDTLKGNPLVRHAVIHSIDKKLLAEIGTPVRHGLYDRSSTEFTRPITLMDVAKGQLYLTVDSASFSAPITGSLQNLAVLGLLLLLVTWILGRRVGEQLRQPLVDLRRWAHDPDEQAPACDRRDEIGDLARLLQERLAVSLPGTETREEAADDFDITLDEDLLRELTLSERLGDSAPAVNPGIWGSAATPAPAPGTAGQDATASSRPARRQEPALAIDDDFQIDLDNLVIDFDEPAPVSPPPRQPARTADADFAIQLPQSLLDSLRFEPPVHPASDSRDDSAPATSAPAAAAAPAANPLTFSTPPRLMSAVLAAHLGNQDTLRQLPHQRLLSLLQRYRTGLEETARHYQGSLYRLDDGGSLILFHSNQSGEHYLQRALCCGEQLRALGLALQAEIADSGLPLILQLALDQGESLYGQPLGSLLRRESCMNVQELRQRSRNQLLLADSLGQDHALRHFARLRDLPPPTTALSVESLAAPWPDHIRQQLNALLRK